jgi:hypothetical protein
MADDIQGLPPGATVGPSLNSQAVEGLPAGATVGPPIQAQGTTGQQQQQGKPVASSTTDLDDISDAFQNEIEKAVGGVGSMLAAPAVHLKNAIVSLAKGNVDETREHFKSALKSLAGGDVLDAQLQSSKQAKDRMMEAAKSGDVLGTVQHAAGVVPGASQVDDAMTKAMCTWPPPSCLSSWAGRQKWAQKVKQAQPKQAKRLRQHRRLVQSKRRLQNLFRRLVWNRELRGNRR